MVNKLIKIESDCSKCFMHSGNIFSCLSKKNVDLLNNNKTTHVYKRGQVIFYEGNPAFAMYCILSGKVKLYKTKRNGDLQVIRLLGAGEIIGYRPLFANEPYATTAEAVEDSAICLIPKSTLFSILKKDTELIFRFLAKLSRELRISEEQILSLTEKSVTVRASELLLKLIDICGEKSKNPIKLKCPISRNEMAQIISTTPESLSRVLHLMSKKGIIELKRNEIIILNLTELKKITGY